MKQFKNVRLILGCIISLVWMYGCSEDSDIKTNVKISVDKASIKADNADKAVFSVTVDGKDMTSSVVITEKNKNTPVAGIIFSTDSAATYTFFATYNNIRSNEINIEAVGLEVLIKADRQNIKANNKDIVTFSVIADGQDVTSLATIISVDSPESTITESGFSTNIPGIYTFFATYDGKKTNEIRIEATAFVLSLSVDKASIKANNRDKSIFKVKADEEDVTSSAVIMQKTNTTDIELDNNEFITDEATIYTFYATYEDIKSNEINVEATYTELAFLRGYSIVQIASTSNSQSPLLTEELIKAQQSLPNQIHLIALHPYGKYCNSELAGALGETAVAFVDRVNKPAPPLAIVDLYDPVPLKATTTQKLLSDAIIRSTLIRDRVSMTGIAVQSRMNGNTIDFVVNVKTKKTDNYRFFAFVVEDGIIYRQANGERAGDLNFIHNNVATYKLTEGDPYLGVSLGTVTEDRETTQSFSINTDQFNTGRNVNFDNCRIVCYTLRSKDGKNYFVDNVTNCPVNGSVRYLYE